MNVLQRHNHALLRKHILSPRIITSLSVLPSGIIKLHAIDWQDYWGKSYLQLLLDKLFLSWHEWIANCFNRKNLNNYIYDYFQLLETALTFYRSEQIDLCFLNKIVAFETFLTGTPNSTNLAASLFSTRNPNYLLHKIPNPIACDDPKYLPIICLRRQAEQTARHIFNLD